MATRSIGFGEELTFDYACVSESREEFASATCLCGSVGCRGSFVAYADERSFMQVADREYGLLRRVGDLLWACEGVKDVESGSEFNRGESSKDLSVKDMSGHDSLVKESSNDLSSQDSSMKDSSMKDLSVKDSSMKDSSLKEASKDLSVNNPPLKDMSIENTLIKISSQPASSTDMSTNESNNIPLDNIPSNNIPLDNIPSNNIPLDNIPSNNIPNTIPPNNIPSNNIPNTIPPIPNNSPSTPSPPNTPHFPPLPSLSLRQASLAARGLKSAVFFQTPPWVAAWAFTVSSFLSRETQQLPAILLSLKDPRGLPLVNSLKEAIVETAGVSATRLQNLAISIDRIRHFLSKQPKSLAMKPPLHLCSEDEILDFFWFDRKSVMWRIVEFGETLANDETAKSVFSQLKKKLQSVHYYCTHKQEIRTQMAHCI